MTSTGVQPGGAGWVLAALVGLHGLLHGLGAAEGLGLADVPQLTEPISPLGGLGWLAAGSALAATAWRIASGKTWWWTGFAAGALSQVMIATSWADARFGTLANVVLFVASAHALAARGPGSLHAEYRQGVDERKRRVARAVALADTETAPLPEPVRRYLRMVRAVGQPRPLHVRAGWRGRIRAGAEDAWIPFTAEQHNYVDEPARFFWMSARRGGVPVDVLHAFRGGEATMRARVLSMFPVVDSRGPEPTRAETVTLLNDVCLLAPGALVLPAFRWEEIDDVTARVFYTVGSNTVSAVLRFGSEGELVDFVSDDRLIASADGKTFTPQRWSTPISSYQSLGGLRVMRRGEGRWHPEGAPPFAYIELDLEELELDPAPSARSA